MVEKDLFIAFICRERISLTSLLFIHTHTHTYGTCARILFTDLHLRETSAHQELVVQRFIIPPPLHSHQKSRGNDLEAKRRCERVCVIDIKIQISSRLVLPLWQTTARPPAPHLGLPVEEWFRFTPAIHSSSPSFFTSTLDPSAVSIVTPKPPPPWLAVREKHAG